MSLVVGTYYIIISSLIYGKASQRRMWAEQGENGKSHARESLIGPGLQRQAGLWACQHLRSRRAWPTEATMLAVYLSSTLLFPNSAQSLVFKSDSLFFFLLLLLLFPKVFHLFSWFCWQFKKKSQLNFKMYQKYVFFSKKEVLENKNYDMHGKNGPLRPIFFLMLLCVRIKIIIHNRKEYYWKEKWLIKSSHGNILPWKPPN